MTQLALFMKTAIKSLLEVLSHSSEKILKDMAGDYPPCALDRNDAYTHICKESTGPHSFSPHILFHACLFY